jgi:hypothetical protein
MASSRPRFFTPIDNAALAQYFTALAKASPEQRAKMEAELEKAFDEGLRPKECVERVLRIPTEKV